MDRLFRPCVAELVGCLLLCFLGAGVLCMQAIVPAGASSLAGALAYGLGVAVAVTATVQLSGGHVNPAVTVTQWVLGKIDTVPMLYYLAAQLLGAVLGGGLVAMIFGATVALPNAHLGTPHVSPDLSVALAGDLSRFAMAALIEAILTFIIVFTWYATACDAQAGRVSGLATGLATAAAVLVAGPLTGAAVNPARYFGLAVWEAGISGEVSRMRDFPVYIVGPVLGAIAAGWLYSTWLMPAAKAEQKSTP